VLNKHRGGCGRRGCGSCERHHRVPCKDFDTRCCRDCSDLPDCLEGVEGAFVRDPVFRGPCAPDPEPCDRDWGVNIFAFCSQSGNLTVSENGGRLPFESNCSYTSGAFRSCRGEFQLICGGTYLVVIVINVPSDQTLTTQLAVALNGEDVPGTTLNIVKPNTGYSATFELNAVVNADEDDVLSVVSSNAFTLTGTGVLGSITILKVN
jgi:hypothetical protein